MRSASLAELARVDRAGYKIERWGSGWVLRDSEEYPLLIAGEGCVSSTKRAAVAEALKRIETEEQIDALSRAALTPAPETVQSARKERP